MAPSLEAENSLLDKVELRISLLSTPQIFEKNIGIFLPPLVLKLGSPYSKVRSRVLEFLSHLLIRIESSEDLTLPVNKLLEQARSEANAENHSQFAQVKLYSYLLAAKGIERLRDYKSFLSLLPILLQNIQAHVRQGEEKTAIYGRCLAIFVTVIQKIPNSIWKAIQEPAKLFANDEKPLFLNSNDYTFTFLGLEDHLDAIMTVLTSFSKLFLLNHNGSYTGLTSEEKDILTPSSPKSFNEVIETRVSVLLFVQLLDLPQIFTLIRADAPLCIMYLFALHDLSHEVRDAASLLNRVIEPQIREHGLAEQKEFIDPLIEYFLGSDVRNSVKPAIQNEIIGKYLIKSKILRTYLTDVLVKITEKALGIPQVMLSGLLFCQVVLRQPEPRRLNYARIIARDLVTGMQSRGWIQEASYGSRFSADSAIRSLEYATLAEALLCEPSIMLEREEVPLRYIQYFFLALEDENRLLIPDVRKALGQLVDCFSSAFGELKDLEYKTELSVALKARFWEVLSKTNTSTEIRTMAIRFACSLFPYSDAEVRFMCFYGLDDPETTSEAERGLNAYWFSHESKEFAFPSFSDLVSQLKVEMERKSARFRKILVSVFQYLFTVLTIECVKGSEYATGAHVSEHWDFRQPRALELEEARFYVAKKLSEPSEDLVFYLKTVLSVFVGYAKGVFDVFGVFTEEKDILVNDGSLSIPTNHFGAVYQNVANFGPVLNVILSVVTKPTLSKIHFEYGIKNVLLNLVDTNENAAHRHNKPYFARLAKSEALGPCANIISLILAQSDEPIDNIIGQVWSTSGGTDFITVRAVISAFLAGKSSFIGTLSNDFERSVFAEKYLSLIETSAREKDWDRFRSFLLGLNEMTKYGFFKGCSSETKAQVWKIKKTIESRISKLDDDACILSYGLLFLAFPQDCSFEWLENKPVFQADSFIQTVYDTHTSTREEYLLAVGETISIMAAGWRSKALSKTIDVDFFRVSELKESSENNVKQILQLVLKASSTTKPSLRKAACVWLLSLVQYCGYLPEIRSKAAELQLCFMRFLASLDNLTQELAATGLGLVYDTISDPELKKQLVRSLMRLFTILSAAPEKLAAGTVERDTQLFEPGVLRTRDGLISTYGDVLSLANDVGDPSLVYKFMLLTRNLALWALRRGAAFGLSGIILQLSMAQMLLENDDLAQKLVVKLYRYRFDPNDAVAELMKRIWNALVPGGERAVSKYSTAIIKDLLNSVISREWRTREAAMRGLDQVMRVSLQEQYLKYLESVWNASFRGMDDVKESVRDAATALTRYLALRLVTLSSSSEVSEEKQRVFGLLIELFMGDKGLGSSVEDIRSFSLKIILELTEKSGAAIQKFIPKLVNDMILLMLTLEPQIANYLSLNARNYDMLVEDVDAHRVMGVGSLPMMAGLEKMLDHVDEKSGLPDLISRLCKTIKRSVGLPLKICASKVVISIVVRKAYCVSSEQGKQLLDACITQYNDRSETVSKAFAYASGHVCRVLATQDLIEYCHKLGKMYFAEEKVISGAASLFVSRHSNVFDQAQNVLLPYAFVAMHDPDTGADFKEMWLENSGGSSSVKYYIDDILSICSEHLSLALFGTREVCSKALADASEDITGHGARKITGVSPDLINKFYEVIFKGCQVRGNRGKIDLVRAMISLSGCSDLTKNEEYNQKVEKIVLQETRKSGKTKKPGMLAVFGKYLFYHPSQELYLRFMEEVTPFFNDKYYENEDDSDSSDNEVKENSNVKVYLKSSEVNKKREKLYTDLMKTLEQAFNPEEFIPEEYLDFVFNIAMPQMFGLAHVTATWNSQLVVSESLGGILGKLEKSGGTLDTKLLLNVYELIKKRCLWMSNVERVKIEAVRAIGKILSVSNDKSFLESVREDMKKQKARGDSSVVSREIEARCDV